MDKTTRRATVANEIVVTRLQLSTVIDTSIIVYFDALTEPIIKCGIIADNKTRAA